MWRPTTPQGILITVGVAAVVLFALAATGAGPLLALAALTAIALYVLYVVGVGVHRRFSDWLSGR
jgi:Flp pilus assembly protein TadB